MPTITIQGTIVEFPNASSSPSWAPAVIQFAEAVEAALASVTGTFDVPPQALTIDSYNPGTNVNIPNLAFPNTDVRAAFIRYSVYRNTSTTTAVEAGTITIAYNPNGSTNNKWETTRQYDGDGQITFTVTDSGQVQFTTATLSGINHVGVLSYSASAFEQ